MYRMVFVSPGPNASGGGRDQFVLQPSTARPSVDMRADSLDAARAEAAEIWASLQHYRFQDPDSYWVMDERDQVLDYQVRDEALTPRSPEDKTRVAEFRRAMVAAGGGLVLPAEAEDEEDADGYACEHTARQLTDDADDFLTPNELMMDDRQRAAIARHPMARDPAQLEHALAFMAGGVRADRGTVGDLQRAWLTAAGNLAAMAQAGLLISAGSVLDEVMRAA